MTWSKSLFFRNYFSGLSLSRLQIEKRSFMGCSLLYFLMLIFFEKFSFWPIKLADLHNSGFHSKIWTQWHLCVIITQFLKRTWTLSFCVLLKNDGVTVIALWHLLYEKMPFWQSTLIRILLWNSLTNFGAKRVHVLSQSNYSHSMLFLSAQWSWSTKHITKAS